MDSTETFNVSVIENFSFWILGSVYLNTVLQQMFALLFSLLIQPGFLVAGASAASSPIYLQLSLCISEGIFALFSAVVKWTFHTLCFSLETAHSCLREALKCVLSQQVLMCHSYSPALRGDVPWWAFAASRLNNCSRTDTSRKQLPEYQGQIARDGSPACSGSVFCGLKGWAVESIPSLKMWIIEALGYWVFSVTWENLFLITVSQILSAGEPRSATLRVMKPLTFLFQILTFKTKSIWSCSQHSGKEEHGKVGAALGLFPSKTALQEN